MFRLENTKLTKAAQINDKINEFKIHYDDKWKFGSFGSFGSGLMDPSSNSLKKALGGGGWDKKVATNKRKTGGGDKRRTRRNRKKNIKRGGGGKQSINKLIWDQHFNNQEGGFQFLKNIRDSFGMGKITSTEYSISGRGLQSEIDSIGSNGEYGFSKMNCDKLKRFIQATYETAKNAAIKEWTGPRYKWESAKSMQDYRTRKDILQLKALCNYEEIEKKGLGTSVRDKLSWVGQTIRGQSDWSKDYRNKEEEE